jgi:hypothetical protein
MFVIDVEIQSHSKNRSGLKVRGRGEPLPPLDQQLRGLIQKNIIEDKVASGMITCSKKLATDRR